MKLFLAILYSTFTLIHPLKISFSKMTFENNIVEIETRLFLDDLSTHLKKKYRIKKIDFSSLSGNGTEALQLYFKESFYLVQKGERLFFKIEDIKFSEDKTILSVFLKVIIQKSSFTLHNTLLLDAFKKQKNVLLYQNSQYEFHGSVLEHTF